eukprot:257541_1
MAGGGRAGPIDRFGFCRIPPPGYGYRQPPPTQCYPPPGAQYAYGAAGAGGPPGLPFQSPQTKEEEKELEKTKEKFLREGIVISPTTGKKRIPKPPKIKLLDRTGKGKLMHGYGKYKRRLSHRNALGLLGPLLSQLAAMKNKPNHDFMKTQKLLNSMNALNRMKGRGGAGGRGTGLAKDDRKNPFNKLLEHANKMGRSRAMTDIENMDDYDGYDYEGVASQQKGSKNPFVKMLNGLEKKEENLLKSYKKQLSGFKTGDKDDFGTGFWDGKEDGGQMQNGPVQKTYG